jgi:nitrite reductase (NADH) small subunit
VLDSAALLEGEGKRVQLGDRAIALVRVDGVAHAIDDLCPHRGGSLGLGDLHGHHLYCPQHAWCFDVRTGEGFFPKGVRVQRFEVAERDGGIYVSMP